MTFDWLLPIATAVVAGVIVWFLQSRIASRTVETQRLHDERRRVYMKLLEPNIRILAGIRNESEAKRAMEQITSFEHRRAMFEFNLVGSDSVVRTMNNFMQYTYSGNTEPRKLFMYLGEALLAIRKDLGNPKTSLDSIDMFRSQVTDIDQFKSEMTSTV